jgi:hypothetical protein
MWLPSEKSEFCTWAVTAAPLCVRVCEVFVGVCERGVCMCACCCLYKSEDLLWAVPAMLFSVVHLTRTPPLPSPPPPLTPTVAEHPFPPQWTWRA